MNIIYSDQPAFDGGGVFLAGPTPRRIDVPSWRPTAIQKLKDLNFSGTVMVPERREFSNFDYINQVEWERTCLINAQVILFWIPREMATMPALTTNVEFGYFLAKTPEKVIYGRPDTAVKIGYLDWLYKLHSKDPIFNNLDDLLKFAVEKVYS